MIATETQARKRKKATINQRHKRYFPEHRYSAGIDGSDGLMDGKPCWGCLNSNLRSSSMNRLRLRIKNENYDYTQANALAAIAKLQLSFKFSINRTDISSSTTTNMLRGITPQGEEQKYHRGKCSYLRQVHCRWCISGGDISFGWSHLFGCGLVVIMVARLDGRK